MRVNKVFERFGMVRWTKRKFFFVLFFFKVAPQGVLVISLWYSRRNGQWSGNMARCVCELKALIFHFGFTCLEEPSGINKWVGRVVVLMRSSSDELSPPSPFSFLLRLFFFLYFFLDPSNTRALTQPPRVESYPASLRRCAEPLLCLTGGDMSVPIPQLTSQQR